MAGVGIVLLWFGYSVFYYGYDQLTGGNDRFVSLIWPGAYAPTARDNGTGAGSSGSGSGGGKKSPLSPGRIPCYIWGGLFLGRPCPKALGG